MPEDKKTESRRMVVEEVELPAKTEEESLVEEKVIEETSVEKPESEVKETLHEKEETVIKKPDVVQQTMDSQTPKKEKSPVFWILIPGIFILGAILGGIIFYQKQVNSDNPEASSTPQASESMVTETPAPSTSPDVDVSEFDVAVYNGSGIAGEAGKVQTILEDAGFSVVSTGNAATYDYTKTIIKAKSDVEDSVIDKIEEALSDSYVVGETQTLSSTSTTDIQIVVGSSKAE